MTRRRILVVAFALGIVAMVASAAIAVWLAHSGASGGDAGPIVLLATPTPRLTQPEKAETDTSSSIPGTYVPSQGRGHFAESYVPTRVEEPFCPGVPWSGAANAAASPTAAPPTPAANKLAATPTIQVGCHNSNPPSSGKHLNVQPNIDLGGGVISRIPPDPDVYPPAVEIPRDSIAHILEHAGVFVGYNCASGDGACDAVIEQLKSLVTDRINNGGDRIVMAHDNDLVPGTIGMASWTRVYDLRYQDYDAKEAQRFMDKNSCRYDPEGFCR